MKFSLSLAAAAAAVLAVGTAAHQQQSSPLPVDKNAQQVPDGALKITDVTEPLFQITLGVDGLRQAFFAYLAGDLGQTANAQRVAAELQGNLTQAATSFSGNDTDGAGNSFSDDDSLKVRQYYDLLYRNVTVVTKALKKNVQAIDKAGARPIIAAILPNLESGFDSLFNGLIQYVSVKYAPSVGKIHKKLDDQLESTLHKFMLNDASDDDNPTAGPNDFPAQPLPGAAGQAGQAGQTEAGNAGESQAGQTDNAGVAQAGNTQAGDNNNSASSEAESSSGAQASGNNASSQAESSSEAQASSNGNAAEAQGGDVQAGDAKDAQAGDVKDAQAGGAKDAQVGDAKDGQTDNASDAQAGDVKAGETQDGINTSNADDSQSGDAKTEEAQNGDNKGSAGEAENAGQAQADNNGPQGDTKNAEETQTGNTAEGQTENGEAKNAEETQTGNTAEGQTDNGKAEGENSNSGAEGNSGEKGFGENPLTANPTPAKGTDMTKELSNAGEKMVKKPCARPEKNEKPPWMVGDKPAGEGVSNFIDNVMVPQGKMEKKGEDGK